MIGTALVTGASRGIGAETARRLAGAGARVALLARSQSALESLAQEIGNDSFAVQADFANTKSVADAISTVRGSFKGAPDLIVSNAGLFTIKALEQTPAAEFETMIAINLMAPFALVQAFLAEMKARGSGHVVTIGSIADRAIFAGNAAYSATKFGARAVHEVLRTETQGSGVRATLISPAGVDTEIWKGIKYYGTDIKPDRSRMLPPAAVADAVMYAVTQPADVNIDELRLSRS
jgi:NADP-dependent 3-hydroxy acid dehydrogenase YdfG